MAYRIIAQCFVADYAMRQTEKHTILFVIFRQFANQKFCGSFP